jgi:hypothetical protein
VGVVKRLARQTHPEQDQRQCREIEQNLNAGYAFLDQIFSEALNLVLLLGLDVDVEECPVFLFFNAAARRPSRQNATIHWQT